MGDRCKEKVRAIALQLFAEHYSATEIVGRPGEVGELEKRLRKTLREELEEEVRKRVRKEIEKNPKNYSEERLAEELDYELDQAVEEELKKYYLPINEKTPRLWLQEWEAVFNKPATGALSVPHDKDIDTIEEPPIQLHVDKTQVQVDHRQYIDNRQIHFHVNKTDVRSEQAPHETTERGAQYDSEAPDEPETQQELPKAPSISELEGVPENIAPWLLANWDAAYHEGNTLRATVFQKLVRIFADNPGIPLDNAMGIAELEAKGEYFGVKKAIKLAELAKRYQPWKGKENKKALVDVASYLGLLKGRRKEEIRRSLRKKLYIWEK